MMSLPLSTIIIMAVGSVFALIYCFLMIGGKEYDAMLQPLDSKEYPLCETYHIGFKLMKIFPKLLQNQRTRKKRQYMEILYGNKYADYYLQINTAQSISLAFLVFVAAFGLYGLSAEIGILFIGILMAVVVFYYYDTLPKETVAKRTDEISLEFANVVSKLALLINAGMIVREAWEKVAYTGDSELYKEMQAVVDQLNNGASESDAFSRFAMRCTTADVKKFTSMLIQGMAKGNQELTEMLKAQNREIWDVRQSLVKQQGEKASSKLLIPMCIMFVGILIMIIVPIFANM